jgi:hypothetical protein
MVVTLRLDGPKLRHQQLDPIEFPGDLRLQLFSQRAAVARPQPLQALAPIPEERVVIEDALGAEQAHNPVGVPDPLGQQSLPFAADAPAVLLVPRRRPDHGAHA